MKYILILLCSGIIFFAGCEPPKSDPGNQSEETTMIKEKIEKFAPTELKYDRSTLDERQQKVVEKIYRAAKIMDEIFATVCGMQIPKSV